jgi:transcriptional regulator with XRE-family HTH domain
MSRRRAVDANENEVSRVLADNLTRYMRDADLSQDDLAVMASVHRTEISMIQRQLRTPKISTALRLASCLEVSLDELVAGVKWRPGRLALGSFQVTEQG